MGNETKKEKIRFSISGTEPFFDAIRELASARGMSPSELLAELAERDFRSSKG